MIGLSFSKKKTRIEKEISSLALKLMMLSLKQVKEMLLHAAWIKYIRDLLDHLIHL